MPELRTLLGYLLSKQTLIRNRLSWWGPPRRNDDWIAWVPSTQSSCKAYHSHGVYGAQRHSLSVRCDKKGLQHTARWWSVALWVENNGNLFSSRGMLIAVVRIVWLDDWAGAPLQSLPKVRPSREQNLYQNDINSFWSPCDVFRGPVRGRFATVILFEWCQLLSDFDKPKIYYVWQTLRWRWRHCLAELSPHLPPRTA